MWTDVDEPCRPPHGVQPGYKRTSATSGVTRNCPGPAREEGSVGIGRRLSLGDGRSGLAAVVMVLGVGLLAGPSGPARGLAARERSEPRAGSERSEQEREASAANKSGKQRFRNSKARLSAQALTLRRRRGHGRRPSAIEALGVPGSDSELVRDAALQAGDRLTSGRRPSCGSRRISNLPPLH